MATVYMRVGINIELYSNNAEQIGEMCPTGYGERYYVAYPVSEGYHLVWCKLDGDGSFEITADLGIFDSFDAATARTKLYVR